MFSICKWFIITLNIYKIKIIMKKVIFLINEDEFDLVYNTIKGMPFKNFHVEKLEDGDVTEDLMKELGVTEAYEVYASRVMECSKLQNSEIHDILSCIVNKCEDCTYIKNIKSN